MKTTKKNYFEIFNSWDTWDEEIIKETREMIAECNNLDESEVSDEWVNECIWGWLDDERANLNKVIEGEGVIVAYVDAGFWDGRCKGFKIVGRNVADILHCHFGGDHIHWYADLHNVHAEASHHDGTHYITFRIAKDEDDAERMQDNIVYGDWEYADFMSHTKSLRPYIARVYGWKGRKALTNMRKRVQPSNNKQITTLAV